MHPQTKTRIKDCILEALFKKEDLFIQKQIDIILDKLTETQVGHFYRYRQMKFGRSNINTYAQCLLLGPVYTEDAETIYQLTLELNSTRALIISYIINALNHCNTVHECLHIFPKFIRTIIDSWMGMDTSDGMATKKTIAFRNAHKKEELMLKHQYTKNLIL